MKKRGRPFLKENEGRTRTKSFRCTPEELEMLMQAAEADGQPFSDWIRDLGLKRAKRVLK